MMFTDTDEVNLEAQQIIDAKGRFLAQRQGRTPNQAIIDLARLAKRPQPLLNIVTHNEPALLLGQITLTDTYDPVAAALRCVRDGADGLAMFTDQRIYSKGMDDLLLVSRGINSPIICQDYILNEYHVAEARAAGASAIVVYSSMLDRPILRRVVSAIQRWRMTAIVQVCTPEELHFASTLSPHVVAIGMDTHFDAARDLPTLETLRDSIPYNVRMMPLGCIHRLEDVEAVARLRPDAVIVDEKLLKSVPTYEAIRELLDYTAGA
ncbi:MAG: hypothetical protein SF029_06360 [bacterium]|nr:hypothetical protein [bacterium]